MANRWFTSVDALQKSVVLLEANVVVDSGQLGKVRSLKGSGIKSVKNVALGTYKVQFDDPYPRYLGGFSGFVSPVTGSPVGSGSLVAPSTPAVGTPNLSIVKTYGALAASAITNTGNTAITGNIGEYPGTALTPGSGTFTVSGTTNIANTAAQVAQAQALAAYTAFQAMTPATIATALDGVTKTPGVYTAASGTFTLAASAGGTLTLNGAGLYVFQMATTLTTGAGGVPVIALTNGARAQDVYFVCGSSATINSGNAGTFNGNVIALASITDTSGGTVNGSLVALNAAVTLSAGTTIVTQGSAPGVYVIVSVGTTTDWHAAGVPAGITPAVGVTFVATGTTSGNGAAMLVGASGANHIEVVGDPNTTINNSTDPCMFIQTLNDNTPIDPIDGSVLGLGFLLRNSSVRGKGE